MYFETSFGKVGISDAMKGKMSDMQAISTSVLLNKNCMKNCKIAGSICEKCYSVTSHKMYRNFKNMMINNTEVLVNHVIKKSDLPFINHTIFRFESHGDINNNTQLKNYVNIAKKNPHVKFALWSKQYKIVEKFFDKVTKPKNFIVIYSSLMKNVELKLKNFKHVDKIFTVYSKEFIAEKNVTINCGAKNCNTCRTCYKKTGPKYIKEKQR